MYILGISCYYHDAAACLLKEGNLIAAAQEERFSRIKHDSSFPQGAVDFCLKQAGISSRDLDLVVFHEKPFLKFERIIKTVLATYPRSFKLFSEVAVNWLQDKLWIKSKISDFLDIAEDKILFCEHHISHAAASLFCSSFKETAVLTVDGVGEWSTTTLGRGTAAWEEGEKNSIEILQEIRFPHSLGLLYSVFTAFLGFKVNNGEYKVMGMSAFGKPRYVDKIYKLINVNPDGSFSLNMEYFSYHYSTRKSFNKNFISLFGEPRKAESRFVVSRDTLIYEGEAIEDEEIEKSLHYADIAASIQKVTEDIMIKIANHLYDLTGIKNLCMGGGVSLNCVSNNRLLNETPFENIFIQPASGDSGAALGGALYAWHAMLNKKRKFILEHVYWGEEHSNEEIRGFLRDRKIPYKKFEEEEELIDYVSDLLIKQKIIGWFQHKFEWGPRALGNRSILSDPRDPRMKDIINVKIKFREPFRPFAPSVIYEGVSKLFDIEDVKDQYPFRFMLYTIDSPSGLIPAATHVDGTSRIQIVHKEINPLYYALIDDFYRKTGVPAVLNTSFNLRGEPIVNTPQEAFATFTKSGIDAIVLNNFVVEKPFNRTSG
ncbi:MAG: hypothetical protein GF375_02505 [Candidatus Omnitrophica bacterium]|nr:hypothetical protein [Candidatus Omnitrophota bacterium]MBD3268972.1 hypothetical protein [Candidatus Omnitrophota bacterium]